VTITEAKLEKPSLDSLRGEVLWRLGMPGTCSPSHFRKMELEKIGTLPVDREKPTRVFPALWLKPSIGTSAAVHDRSIANSIEAHLPQKFEPTVLGIEQILQQ